MNEEIKLANKISARCLVSGLGHDWVDISRDSGGSTESWIECHACHMTIGELERLERECREHDMRCIICGYPMMKNRAKYNEDEED